MGVQLSGTELIATQNNRDFENNSVGDWSAYSGGVLSINSTTPLAGSYSLKVVTSGVGKGARLSVAGMTAGMWIRGSCVVRGNINHANVSLDNIGIGNIPLIITSIHGSGIYTAGDNRIYILSWDYAYDIDIDTWSIQQIVQSSLFSQMRNSGSSIITEASVATTYSNTLEANNSCGPIGVVICANDITTPTKYLLGVYNHPVGVTPKVQLYAVNGSSVTLYQANVTYGDGYRVKFVKNSDDLVSLYYNNSLKLSQTIAGYTDTNHGLFNTDDENTLGAYTLPDAALEGTLLTHPGMNGGLNRPNLRGGLNG